MTGSSPSDKPQFPGQAASTATTAPKTLSTWLFEHRLLVATVVTFSVNLPVVDALFFWPGRALGEDAGWIVLLGPFEVAAFACAPEGLACVLLLQDKKTRRIALGIAIGALAFVAAALLWFLWPLLGNS